MLRGAAPMGLVNLLKTVSLFNGLSDSQLQRLIDISEEESYSDGDVIFNQGAEGDKLYFITEGQVEIRIRKRPGEPERSQVFLGRGQIFGEMALLDLGKRSATVKCSQDRTALRVISSEAFADLCNSDTAIGYIIMRNMAMDLSFKLRHRNLDLGADSL
jgi:CRP-like cAMP-binding protein